MFSDSQWDVLQNRNVQRILMFCFIDGSCFSLWRTQVFSVLVNKLSGDTVLGWISAVSGIAQMAAAFAVGFANTMGKEQVLRIATLNGICAVCLSLIGVAMYYIPLLFFASILWGTYAGTAATTTEALFADSVASGKRDFVYNLKWVNETLCACVGSVTSLLMLLYLGNEWSLGSLQTVMFIGLILHPIAHGMLLTMKVKYALGENCKSPVISQSATGSAGDKPVLPVANAEENRIHKSPELSFSNENGDSTHTPTFPLPKSPSAEWESVLLNFSAESAARRERYFAAQEKQDGVAWYATAFKHYCGSLFEWKTVPYLVCIEDFWVCIGSGMTIQYIPLFFVNDHGTSPVTLMSAYVCTSLVQALFASLVQYAGKWYINRVTGVIIARAIGIMLLLIMALAELHVAVLLVIFVIRCAAMNSTQGVTRSVIMDCVSKENRAKWSAFESFSSFTWAGSAVIGGYLAEARGYRFTFLITAIIHFCALLILVPAVRGSQEMEKLKRDQLKLEREEEKNAAVVEELEIVNFDVAARTTN